MKKVNSIMVAREAGVVQSTVSLVINNSPRVSDDTRRRVIEAARKLGYRLEPQSKKLLIGIIISRTTRINSYQAMALSYLKNEIYRRGHRLEIICNEDIQILNERVVSGAISISGDHTINQAWSTLRSIPLVRFASKGRHSDNIYTVYTDHRANVDLALGYLNKFNHRRVGLFMRRRQEEEMDLLERTGEYFQEKLLAAGIEHPERLVSYNDDTPVSERLKRLLGEKITALAIIPGDTALQVLQELRRLKIRIPEDLSVITREFENVSEYWDPPLTSIFPDYQLLSSSALDLLENFHNRKAGQLRDIAVPGHLIERKSVILKISP